MGMGIVDVCKCLFSQVWNTNEQKVHRRNRVLLHPPLSQSVRSTGPHGRLYEVPMFVWGLHVFVHGLYNPTNWAGDMMLGKYIII